MINYDDNANNETISNLHGINVISFNNTNPIHIWYTDYIGFFYNWYDFKKYINHHKPEMYLNKLFTIELNNTLHYYLIVANDTIEEVNLSDLKISYNK